AGPKATPAVGGRDGRTGGAAIDLVVSAVANDDVPLDGRARARRQREGARDERCVVAAGPEALRGHEFTADRFALPGVEPRAGDCRPRGVADVRVAGTAARAAGATPAAATRQRRDQRRRSHHRDSRSRHATTVQPWRAAADRRARGASTAAPGARSPARRTGAPAS